MVAAKIHVYRRIIGMDGRFSQLTIALGITSHERSLTRYVYLFLNVAVSFDD